MSNAKSYTVERHSRVFSSTDHKDLNPAQFIDWCNRQLQVFITEMEQLRCDFVSLPDLSHLKIECRFFQVNGQHAVRSLRGYEVSNDSQWVRLDAEALKEVEDTEAAVVEQSSAAEVQPLAPDTKSVPVDSANVVVH